MDLIKTNIKFYKGLGNAQDRIYGFVTKTNGSWRGCRETEAKKKIVFVRADIAPNIIPNLLYHCSLAPMRKSEGFIANSATPIKFDATISIKCTKKIHLVKVMFGNKTIIYDPSSTDRRKRDIQAIAEILKNRPDLVNPHSVATEFVDNACMVKRFYEQFKSNV